MFCYLNGELLDELQARVPISDRGFLYGDGLFETLRVQAGRPVFLAPHLDRLEVGLELLGFEIRPSRTTIEAACAQVLEANQLAEGVLRIAVTRGSGSRGANPAGCPAPTLLVTTAELPANLAERRERGYRLVVAEWRKPSSRVLPNQAKLGNYLNSILAMRSAVKRGADEAVLLDEAGHVVECSQCNLFFVSAGTLLTANAASGALHGITRAQVLALATQLGVPVREADLPHALLTQAQEAFITNSVIGVMPVASIEASTFAVPGEVTARLQAGWSALLREAAAAPA